MSLRKIAEIGEPVLRQPARELGQEELVTPRWQTLIDELIATMRDAQGAGLAAPQVYESVRICCIEVSDNPRYPYKPRIPLTVLVNPHVRALADERFFNYEGCLSVPNLRGSVPRFSSVEIRAWDRHGEPLVRTASGLEAATYQHEIDHLDGVLFVDHVEDPRSLCTWRAFERHHREAFLQSIAPLIRKP